jgi:hypothetical protein
LAVAPSELSLHLSTAHMLMGRTSLEFSDLSTVYIRASPIWNRRHPVPVPFSGFLNLSTVSQQAQTAQSCFVLQPFLGFSAFRGFPLQRSRALLRTASSPAVVHGCAGKYCSKSFALGFADAGPFRVPSQVPPKTMSSLSANQIISFPVALDSAQQNLSLPLASSTSKLSSLRKSVPYV